MFEAIADHKSNGENWAVHRHAQKGRMFASAGQASDEHPLRQALQPKPLLDLGPGAVAAIV
jgi:hypothetical protein